LLHSNAFLIISKLFYNYLQSVFNQPAYNAKKPLFIFIFIYSMKLINASVS